LVNFLITQNESSRSAIRSVEFDYTINDLLNLPAATTQPVPILAGHVVRSGSSMYASGSQRVTTGPDIDHKTGERLTKARVVINDHYVAIWDSTEANLPVQYTHVSIRDIPAKTWSLIHAYIGEDPLLNGFGLGTQGIRETFAPLLAHPEWWAVQQGKNEVGETIFSVKLLFTQKAKSPGSPHIIYDFDADRGFLITHIKSFTQSGDVAADTVIESEKFDGVWLPKKVVEEAYASVIKRRPDTTKELVNQLAAKKSVEFKYLMVNEQVSPEKFLIDALDIPDGKLINRFALDGGSTWEYHKGRSQNSDPSAVQDSEVKHLSETTVERKRSIAGSAYIYGSLIVLALTVTGILVISQLRTKRKVP
jgi:hypothetical protein